MADWNLHYASWMIGDGEPERRVGEVFDWFAVEFFSKALSKTSRRVRSATPAQTYGFYISAEVIFLTEESAVIDFGLVAIGNRRNLDSGVIRGDFVVGEISLGLPLCIAPIPDEINLRMSRQWRVNGISADLTSSANGRLDLGQLGYKQVTSTTDLKALDYVLHCTELGPSSIPYPFSR